MMLVGQVMHFLVCQIHAGPPWALTALMLRWQTLQGKRTNPVRISKKLHVYLGKMENSPWRCAPPGGGVAEEAD